MTKIPPSKPSSKPTNVRFRAIYATGVAALALICSATLVSAPDATPGATFGPSNPFYAPSTLPFQAPPFDKIKDGDYQPAILAGMAEQIKEVEAIANDPAPPTF